MLERIYFEVTLEKTSFNGRRYYYLPGVDILVPSVTTVLYAGKEFPDTPKMRMARNRGEIVHEMVEDYLIHDSLQKKSMPVHLETFQKFKKVIDKYLEACYLVETQVYSKRWLTAGTIDCVGKWDGKLSIIDWKTSFRPKQEKYMSEYKMQAAVYADCFAEVHGSANYPEQAIVVVANDEDVDAQIFKYSLPDVKLESKMKEIYIDKRRFSSGSKV